MLVVSVGVEAGACAGGPSGGAYGGPSVGRSGVPWRGRGSGWGCVAAARLACGWRPCVDASGGVWGCGAGLAVEPGAGSMRGCAVPGGCSGRQPTAHVFLGLGTAPLQAGDARRPWIPVAAWCSGWCRCAARLDARSCRGLCGALVLDGAGTSVVRVASAACCRSGEVMGAWGAEVDRPEDVEAVGPCGASTPDGARARTLVAPVGTVALDRGGRVVMLAVLREEEEELWCRAPPVIILATAALPYVPGPGGGTCSCWARRTNGVRLRGRGMPLHVRLAAISLSVAPLVMAPPQSKETPHSPPWAPLTIPIARSASPTSRLKANGRRPVRVTTVVR